MLSPKVWMCMPRLALASWPVMSQLMVVGSDSAACSKVTVPVILESPRTTATRYQGKHGLSVTRLSSREGKKQLCAEESLCTSHGDSTRPCYAAWPCFRKDGRCRWNFKL